MIAEYPQTDGRRNAGGQRSGGPATSRRKTRMKAPKSLSCCIPFLGAANKTGRRASDSFWPLHVLRPILGKPDQTTLQTPGTYFGPHSHRVDALTVVENTGRQSRFCAARTSAVRIDDSEE